MANSPVSGSSNAVTNLGVFDNNHPSGLDLSHGVAFGTPMVIWLVSATGLAGAVDPLVNQFRYVSIAPTKLGPGTYTIGATWLILATTISRNQYQLPDRPGDHVFCATNTVLKPHC